MQKFIKTDLSEIRYFEDDVNVGDWIDLSQYRLMTEAEITKHETPRTTEFHTIWVWDNEPTTGHWEDSRSPEQIAEHERSSLPALTRRQFMRALVLNNYDLDEIEAMIDSIKDEKNKKLALIDWKDATDFQRNDATLLLIAGMLNLTQEEIDTMWRGALGI